MTIRHYFSVGSSYLYSDSTCTLIIPGTSLFEAIMSQSSDLVANIMDLFDEEDDSEYYPSALPSDYSELAETTEGSDANDTMEESEDGEYTGRTNLICEETSLNSGRRTRISRACRGRTIHRR